MFPKEIIKKFGKSVEELDELLNKDVLTFVLQNLGKKNIVESQVKQVLERIVEGVDLKESIKFDKANVGDLEEQIMKIIKSKPGLNPNAYMGLVMKEFRGQIDGKEVMQIIKKYAK